MRVHSEAQKMSLKKGTWSPEEDRKLITYINRYGIWNWSKMAEPAGLLRSGKSCRLRWLNYLSPKVRRGNFTCEEDEIITRMHKALGNKWSAMAAVLPGRTDNEIKNRWHTHLSKRIRQPATEKSQGSSTVSDAHKFDPSQLDLLPKYDFTKSPISPSPYGSGLSPDTSSSSSTLVETSEAEQNIEASSLPNFVEDLYQECFEQVFDEFGFLHPFNEFLEPEPMSPFNCYSSGSYGLWTDLPVSADMDEVLIEPLFQF